MSLQAVLKGLAKAVPVILANAPAIISVFTEVKAAVKKPKKVPADPAAEPPALPAEAAVG